MKKELLEALEEMDGEHFDTLDAAMLRLSPREILDTYLEYEGISGYTHRILSALESMGILDADDVDTL